MRAALTMHDYDYDVARCVEINCNALHAIDAMLGPLSRRLDGVGLTGLFAHRAQRVLYVRRDDRVRCQAVHTSNFATLAS